MRQWRSSLFAVALFLVAGCGAQPASWPPREPSTPWTPADTAACWNENSSLAEMMTLRSDTLSIVNDWNFSRSVDTIPIARQTIASDIAALIPAEKAWAKTAAYHIASQMQDVWDGLAGLQGRFALPMSEQEFSDALDQEQALEAKWDDWRTAICDQVEAVAGPAPPTAAPRY